MVWPPVRLSPQSACFTHIYGLPRRILRGQMGAGQPRRGQYTPAVPIDLNAYQAVLLDLDGTVYHEDHSLPGAVELIRRLQAEDRTYACLTNSTSSPQRLATRLTRMGVEVDPAHIYTAAAATC